MRQSITSNLLRYSVDVFSVLYYSMGRCQSAVSAVVDMRHYNELLDAIPEPNIAHIVNCMTEQVHVNHPSNNL